MSVRAEVRDVSVRLGSVQALDGIGFAVEPGQFLSLLGPSGSGKTTTLNVLAGFVRPDRGTVELDGRDTTDVPPRERDLGIVFQGYALFPHMSVAENVAFPLSMRKVQRARRQELVSGALQLVGLEQLASRAVRTLSGGQQQRVALARAIVFEPRMMLLDEPLAALDKQLRDSMQLELKRLQRRVGITTVAVTHDQVEALSMSDIVAVMNDGRIEQIAAPQELYLQPATRFVATFLGEANLIPVRSGELLGFGALGGGSGDAVVRPEHLAVTQNSHVPDGMLSATATLEEVTFQGSRLRARARLRSHPETVLTVAQAVPPDGGNPRPDEPVALILDPRAVHVIP